MAGARLEPSGTSWAPLPSSLRASATILSAIDARPLGLGRALVLARAAAATSEGSARARHSTAATARRRARGSGTQRQAPADGRAITFGREPWRLGEARAVGPGASRAAG